MATNFQQKQLYLFDFGSIIYLNKLIKSNSILSEVIFSILTET